ncbi:MAG TPA: AMP-binding protein [Clostridia bacterium]
MKKNAPLYDVRHINDLRDMLAQSRALYADQTAFLVKDRRGGPYLPVTFRQYAADVDAFGTALADAGLKGGRIAILAETRYEWYVSYLATTNGTGVVVPLDKELPVGEIRSLLERSRADAVIYSSSKKEQMDLIREDNPGVRHFICMDAADHAGDLVFQEMLEKGRTLLAAGSRQFLDVSIDRNAMDILLFTSGTTAMSKAVMLSHANICANLEGMCAMLYIGPGDIFLSVLPLHHTYECTCGFLCQIYRGSTIAQCEGLRYIVQNMQEAKVTTMLAVPLMLELFHRNIMKKAKATPEAAKKFQFAITLTRTLRKVGIDLRRKLFHKVHDSLGGHLKMLISGGAAVDPNIMRDMRDLGILCVQGYGLTECAPILALNRDVNYKDQSAGLPLPGVDVRIIDADENGIGEIIGKGPNVMLGYYENKEATTEALRNGYFHTGDLGYIDKDGFIIITGRKKNVIITKNGKNIFPEEIETLLCRSLYIAEALVSGADDGEGDVEVVADIFPDAEAITAKLGVTSDPAALRALIAQEVTAVNHMLTTYKYVRKFNLRDTEFEKTTSKKIKRAYTK